MKVLIKQDAGWCDGIQLVTGDIVELTPTAARDYVALGIAEEVVEKAEAAPEVAVETAAVEPSSNAAARVGRAKARKKV